VTLANIHAHLLVQGLQSSSSGKSGLVVGEGIKGELAVIGTTPTVSHTSKWHVVNWTEGDP